MLANDTTTLPNPFTPLAFLDPKAASQYEASRYLYVATLGAFTWDWLVSMQQEIELIRHHHSLPTLAYFISRMGTMAWILTCTVFQIAPVPNCQALDVALGWCFVAAVPSTGFLFFLRIRAIFHQNRIVVALFFVSWLITLGASIMVPFGVMGTHVGTTQYCINLSIRMYAGAGTIANMANGTLVFLAISSKLLSMNGQSSRVKAFVKGEGFPRLSSVILTSGQLYYFATVGLNIVTVAMIYAPGVTVVFRTMFCIPNVALENAMACRVFRILKFDAIGTTYIDTIAIEDSGPISFPQRGNRVSKDPEAGSHALVNLRTTQVTVTKEVETHSSFDLSHKDGMF